MIDHLSLGSDDIVKSMTFYDAVMKVIGCERLAASDDLVAYGRERFMLAIMKPFNGEPATFGNGTHIAFHARSNEEVDEFYKQALANGGSCDGEPGSREYPHATVYAAYMRDPSGNKIEVITGGFA